MRVAWLRAATGSVPDSLDDTAPLIAELRASHQIDVVGERDAHDIVWRHARHPFDLFVHELADTPAHAFIAPYAIHYPGVLMLRGFAAHHPRAIHASRAVVVGDEAVAASLRDTYPGVDVRWAPVGVEPEPAGADVGIEPATPNPRAPTRFGVLGRLKAAPTRDMHAAPTTDDGGSHDSPRLDVVERAAQRARDAGTSLEVITGSSSRVLRDADVIVALDWPPPAGPPVTALMGMAAARPVVVFETLVTAAWPALDPQTWQPRGYEGAGVPVAVSIDPRDEEHSLMLAMKRLSADQALRDSLGAAARTWWRDHATIAHAVAAWRRILDQPGAPPRPAFAGADGSEHAREVLAAFGVEVDFL